MNQRIVTESDIVSSLLSRPFGIRNANEKKIIVHEGRPMPKLETKAQDRVLRDDWYIRKDWLCEVKVRRVYFVGLVAFSPWSFTIMDRNLLLQHAPLLLLDFFWDAYMLITTII